FLRRPALARRLRQPIDVIGYVGIAGIEMFATNEPREAGLSGELQIAGIGVNRRAALIAHDASLSNRISQPVEEGALLRWPVEADYARKNSGQGKKAGKGEHSSGRQRPDRHDTAVVPN